MIAKERGIPIKLQKLEALLRRLPHSHPKIALIKEEYLKVRAGYQGEKSLDYYLSLLPDKKYYIFHQLRLPFKQQHFQIDTLVLSPYFMTILEVKNISGTITFDYNFNQLIRTKNGIEEAFQDPISQVKRHQFQLKYLLQENKYLDIPIIPQVIISNPSTLIKKEGFPQKNPTNITQSTNLIFEIEKLTKMNKKEVLAKNQLTKLVKLLLKKHIPEEYDVLKQFEINKDQILRGVHCPDCSKISMLRVHGKWICQSCQFSSKTAHVESLKDYALLISAVISNIDVREFLQISSQTLATNILQSLNVLSSGKGRSTMYHLGPKINLLKKI
ncbi:nuclease-related domain-containing protein [Bacillus sp. FJAT-49736]|uniref:nuclease-related domain-containing protein n=1 Tax=Bacillus sp. FJAT-49736 TaxID=2833582 RepID=UPI001BCA25F9|nr:nuclease-related domain-containing protein [Bacillus sp. FJAT-49736]MBS4175658.1 NERD domain-containing protein [Bacillus sp. FJAT-49736]